MACDICNLPFVNDSADMILSSSVLEHVYDPECAVAEMHRVLKPGGYVYAEVPFMCAYHMKPIDYQRYTISGIERLFARHGFKLLDKGICSGPFTGLALFFRLRSHYVRLQPIHVDVGQRNTRYPAAPHQVP